MSQPRAEGNRHQPPCTGSIFVGWWLQNNTNKPRNPHWSLAESWHSKRPRKMSSSEESWLYTCSALLSQIKCFTKQTTFYSAKCLNTAATASAGRVCRAAPKHLQQMPEQWAQDRTGQTDRWMLSVWNSRWPLCKWLPPYSKPLCTTELICILMPLSLLCSLLAQPFLPVTLKTVNPVNQREGTHLGLQAELIFFIHLKN